MIGKIDNMTNAIIKIEFLAGSDITESFVEAIKLAKKLDIWVSFKFNGIDCNVYKNNNVQECVDSYHKNLDLMAKDLY